MRGKGEAQFESAVTGHRSRVSIIVAMAKNRVIGADNRIPWHLPSELKLFKTVTLGHHIIMGRKTYESINRLLPGRTTVIVTRQPGYQVPGALIAHHLRRAPQEKSGSPGHGACGGWPWLSSLRALCWESQPT